MKKTYCRTAALFLVTALAASTVFAGCGKKEVDYSVDGEGGGSSGEGGKLASRLNIPESYSGTLEGIDSGTGLTEVKIDASSITVPDTDSMSVLYYEQNNGDSEYKKRICENFFDVSAGVYLYDYEKPYKGDVEAEIATWQGYAESAESDEEKASYDEYISELEEQLKTASTEREGAGDYSGDTFIGSVGENQFMISFMSLDGENVSGFSIDFYPSSSLISYRPKEGATEVWAYSAEYSDEEASANTASVSQDEAVQVAMEFLAGCGITDVVETSASDILWEYVDSEYNSVAMEKCGYVINFKRSVDGIAPYTPYTYNIEKLNSDDVWYDSEDESFEVYVDDNGIFQAYCYDYYRATDEKTENVDLITWDKALESLPSAINTYYADGSTSYSSIDFNDVRLAYYKISEDGKYKYLPVWAFAECDELDDGELDAESPIQLVLLDATTGDLIDLTKVLTSESVDDDDSLILDDSDEEEGSDEDLSDEDLGDVELGDDQEITLDEDGAIVLDEGDLEEVSEEDTESGDGDTSEETEATTEATEAE